MSKVDIIIYSKDRAMQLDLLLRSIKDKFKSVGKVFILWTYSDNRFKEGYLKLINKNYGLDIFYLCEGNFQIDVIYLIHNMQTDSYLGLCDDDVFIKDTDISEILPKLYEPEVSSISLRHGLDIVYGHPGYPEILLPLPQFIENGPFLKWEWGLCDYQKDWGYPACINSYIFLREYFLKLIDGAVFKQTTTLEGGLSNSYKERFKKYIVSFLEIKLLNIPTNRVQNISPNVFGREFVYSAKELNDKFLRGDIIDTSNIYDIKAKKINQEIKFEFKTNVEH